MPNNFQQDSQKQSKIILKGMGIIRLTERCNLNCKICYRNMNNHRTDLNSEHIRRLIAKYRHEKKTGVRFTGGEPTLVKELSDYVSFARQQGLKHIRVSSNGWLLAEKSYAKKLVDNGLNEANISLHGHTPETHDSITSVKGSFSKAIKAIKNLSDLGILLIPVITINSYSYTYLKEITAQLLKFNIYQLMFFHTQPRGRALENFSMIPKYSSLTSSLQDTLHFCDENNIKYVVTDVPRCYLGKNYKGIAGTQFLDDVRQNFIKLDICKTACPYENNCIGFYYKYLGLFGIDKVEKEIKDNLKTYH